MNSLLLIGMLLFVVANLGQIPLPQTDFYLSEEGFYFNPDEGGDWLDHLDTDSVGDCAYHCNMNPSCRTFEYYDDINHCELFQVEPSPQQIGFDPSKLTYLGYVQLHPQLFLAFNKSCDACVNRRYLICYQGLCRCTWQTFWNGKICEKQRYAGKTCNGIDQCRNNPLGLTCNSLPICSATGEKKLEKIHEIIRVFRSRIFSSDLFDESNCDRVLFKHHSQSVLQSSNG